ncbi:MAG: pyridoxal-phosphate dependent enzyme [Alphaproteobacteria bacterium]
MSSSNKMNNILNQVGNTPIVKLNKASEISGANIYAKCEFLNPGGSIKDRAAKQILIKAMENGDLKKGDTFIEATAGNTGISLTLFANALGLKSIIVMPENQAQAKKDALKNLGAELILAPAVPLADENNFRNMAKRLSQENGYFLADQFNNLENRNAHAENTATEIAKQLPEINGFICSAGTGGTIGGCEIGLRKLIKDIKIGLADPDGANLYNYYTTGELSNNGKSSIMEGIGQSAITPNLADLKIDYAYNISDTDAVACAFEAISEGINAGLSSGMNIAGSIAMGKELGKDSNILTFICDTSDKYKEKMFNKDFLNEKGITPPNWI